MSSTTSQNVTATLEPKKIKPHPRFDFIADNLWQWLHEVQQTSPKQPICNLGTGFNEQLPPDFVQPSHAEVLHQFEHNQYAPITGNSGLKRAISLVYSPRYERQLTDSEILVGSGAQEVLLSCVLTVLGPSDEAILLEPAFSMYEYQIALSSATIKYVSIRPPSSQNAGNISANQWTIDIEEPDAAITPNTKLLYLNNPHNPLGKVFTRQELLDIGSLCVKHGLVILSDEV